MYGSCTIQSSAKPSASPRLARLYLLKCCKLLGEGIEAWFECPKSRTILGLICLLGSVRIAAFPFLLLCTVRMFAK